MEPADSLNGSNRVPLVIGVAGHRNISPDDAPALKDRVREVFRELRRDYPHTPLVLLSPLNEGADRLVADVALERESGAALIAVLPWPKDVYPEGHFRSGDRAEFDRLLAGAADVIYVPLDAGEGVRAEDLPHCDKSRRNQYRYVGKLIARHSQLLIALWDGVESSESATWRVIDWQRNGAPAPYAVQFEELDDPEPGPIFHVVTPRVGTPRPKNALALKQLYPPANSETGHPPAKSKSQNSEELIRRIWKHINQFNRDAGDVEKNEESLVAKNRGYIIPDSQLPTISEPVKKLLAVYALADTASQKFQKQTIRTAECLLGMAFLSVMTLEIYAHLFSARPVLVTHLVLLLLAFSWYVIAQRKQLQGRYLDYRALAEALRVQLFWTWAGLPDCAADHYLRHFRGDLDWIRAASRSCFLLFNRGDGSSSNSKSATSTTQAIKAVKKLWIEDQQKFFSKNRKRDHHRERMFEIGALVSFGIAVLLAVIQLSLVEISHALILLLFGALVIAAILEKYADYRAFAVQSRMYHWMAELYQRADERLHELIGRTGPNGEMASKDIDKARSLIWELGKEALAENADWVVQHRQRPFEWKQG